MRQPIMDSYPYPIESSFPKPVKRKLMSGFKRVKSLSVFSTNKSAFDQLFPLLQNPSVGPAVWDILNLLPPARDRVARVLLLHGLRQLV